MSEQLVGMGSPAAGKFHVIVPPDSVAPWSADTNSRPAGRGSVTFIDSARIVPVPGWVHATWIL